MSNRATSYKQACGFHRGIDTAQRLVALVNGEIVERCHQGGDFELRLVLQPTRQAFAELPYVARHVLEQERHAAQKFHLRRQVQSRFRRFHTTLEVTVPTTA